MKIIFLRFVILISALAPVLLRAGGEEVVLVYNTRVPESKAVAEHYAQMRHVPENQIFGFALTIGDEISRAEFRDALQLPLAKKLEAEGLWKFSSITVPAVNGQPARVLRRVVQSKIRYAVLCYGVPLRIANDPDIHEAIPAKVPELFQSNEASVDSELAWLPIAGMNPPLDGPMRNWVYGTTNVAMLDPTNGILLVARLDGPSPEIARGLVDKAMQAERDGLWGRAYFDARGLPMTDTNYILGDEWILGAADIAHDAGFETVVDDKPETFPADFPMSQIAIYCGWYDGNADGPFALPKVEFMPGAFAYHLHSYSASTLRSTTANWCGPLLAKGATCTMGCVDEPSIQFTPNIALFLERFAVGRFTFGEAAWASQTALSWQTTVVGDPLYRPFGKSPQQLQLELSRRHSPQLEWAYLRLADLGLVHGTSPAEVTGLIENLNLTANSAVLTEKLGDLCAAQGKPSSAIDYYRRALKLNPSPQQRIRLRLTLGEKLQAEGRAAEAVKNYQQLLAESPDYPGKDFISNTLAALRQEIAGTNAPGKP